MNADVPPVNSSDGVDGRLAALERENQRLRSRLEPLLGPDDPSFNPRAFHRALTRYLLLVTLPVALLLPLASVLGVRYTTAFPRIPVGPTVLVDVGGLQSGTPGLGRGIVAFGGLSIGVIAFGGCAIGVLAVGGGALGVLAVGGGAVGLIAVGGGAAGYVALGGGAYGKYALGSQGAGRFVFSLKRRDKEAVEFFCRYLPGLKKCLTGPMPVVPVEANNASRAFNDPQRRS